MAEQRRTIYVCRGCGGWGQFRYFMGCRCGIEEPSLKDVHRIEVVPASKLATANAERRSG